MLGCGSHRFAQDTRVGALAIDEALSHSLVHQRLDRLPIKLDIEPFGHAPDLGAKRGIAVDHRHSIHGLIKIFDHWLRADKIDPLVRLNHHRSFTGGVQVHELVAAFPRVLAHQFMADTLLGEDQADLARKGAERELEELPHGAAALAAKAGASSGEDRSDRAYSPLPDLRLARHRRSPVRPQAMLDSPRE